MTAAPDTLQEQVVDNARIDPPRPGALEHVAALRAIDAIVAELTRRNRAAAAAVCDGHGELIAVLRIGDPMLSCMRVAINKAYTAARERLASAAVGKAVSESSAGYDMAAYFGDARYVGWGGGIPVWRDGYVIGAVAVSGLSEPDDIEIAELGAAAATAPQALTAT